MITRTYKALTSRPVFVLAAALAILMLAAPFVFAATSVNHPENSTDPVATFSATDQDGDPIVWSLGGTDVDDFTIDGGVLAFESAPDYEEPTSEAVGTLAARNVYVVDVQANGAKETVTVTVTNVDEDGKVSFDGDGQFQPQVGRDLVASHKDQDGGVSDEKWQWARGPSASGPWTDIEKATGASRLPAEADIGSYLQATVTYTDMFGSGKTASLVTDNTVEERTLANAGPSFSGQDDRFDDPETPEVDNTGTQVNRSVDEGTGKGVAIGKPVSASDGDGDVLVYTLNGTDAGNYSLDKTSGQLKTNAALTSDNDGNAETNETATVMVTATDPSGASASIDVTITINDVNDAPKFDSSTEDGTQAPPKKLYVTENSQALRVGSAGTAAEVAAATYDAGDVDSEEEDDSIAYTVEGSDAKYFVTPIGTDGLEFLQEDTNTDEIEAHTPNFESKSSYSITIVASSGADDRLLKSRVDVTVMVQDAEDTGSVSMTQREPQVGRPVVASVSDDDGGVVISGWQWYRGGTPDGTTGQVEIAAPGSDTPLGAGIDACDATTTAGELCGIPNATSASYVPVDADMDQFLTARATYSDNMGTETVRVTKTTEADVQISNPANTAPKFPDQDSTTPGDQSDEAMRTVEENTASGQPIGAPVSATDMDLMMYSLGGADAASFSVTDSTGQIKTKAKLDYETKSSYMVMVTATDPSGATDSIMVMIMVTDGPDNAVIAGVTSESYAENDTAPVVTFSATDQDGDAIVWSLGGTDADDFTIDGGILAFKSAPDYEKPTAEAVGTLAAQNVYVVDVQANGGKETVTVTVTNVDEDGKVSFDGDGQFQPQVGRGLVANFSDQDGGVSDEKWQWARSESASGPWTDIEKATSTSRMPVVADIGSYLQATVTYTDMFGSGKMASLATDNTVEERTLANAGPSFSGQDDRFDDPETTTEVENIGTQVNRSVDEGTGKGVAIGKPVSASDGDGDVLVYTLNGTDAGNYSLDKTSGQLKTNAALTSDNDGNAETNETATVMVTATDPSGASASIDVTITINDVNDAPKFDSSTEDGTQAPPKKLYVTENSQALRVGSAGTAAEVAAATYDAGDVDSEEEDDSIAYTVEGSDAKYFVTPIGTDGLEFLQEDTNTDEIEAHTPNFESKSSYSITIVASSGADDRLLKSRVDVTVMVQDAEDTGSVSMTQREPQVGRPVVASVSDDDGGVVISGWQWYRGGTLTDGEVTIEEPTETAPLGSGIVACEVTTAAGTLCGIPNATSASYVPVDADMDQFLTARATYSDNMGTETVRVTKTTEADVQISNPANTAPKFPDQDSTTPGDQSDEAMRTVEENTASGQPIGAPVSATDMDLLMYSLGGADAASFSVTDSTGQIKTNGALDYETKDTYMVMVVATDPSGASDSIMVTIMVTDVNDDAAITLGPGPATNTAPEFPEASFEGVVDENFFGYVELNATDADDDEITYSLSGADAGDFEIVTHPQTGDPIAISVERLDYETKSSYMFTVTASDGEDSAEMDVTVMVTDMYPGCTVAGNIGLTNDCEALLDSEDALGGSLNWNEDTAIADWDGVNLDEDSMRVTNIYLRDSGLDGMIPASLGRLDALERLQLHDNDLTGPLPDELGDLDNLEWLILHRNAFTGSIPAALGDMDSIDYLYLYSNDGGFDGGIPSELGNATSLRRLYLHDNGLTGEIPGELGDLPILRNLLLSRNNLTGSIPSELGNLSNLKALYLYMNMLTGPIPASLGNMVQAEGDTLRILYLHMNMLDGGIPMELGNLTSLTNLWLNGNMLTGDVPSELDSLSNLDRWRLSGNMLTGCIPAALAGVENSDMAATGLDACADGN